MSFTKRKNCLRNTEIIGKSNYFLFDDFLQLLSFYNTKKHSTVGKNVF